MILADIPKFLNDISSGNDFVFLFWTFGMIFICYTYDFFFYGDGHHIPGRQRQAIFFNVLFGDTRTGISLTDPSEFLW